MVTITIVLGLLCVLVVGSLVAAMLTRSPQQFMWGGKCPTRSMSGTCKCCPPEDK